MFNGYSQSCLSKLFKELPEAHVWRLYDTPRFPVDLSQLTAEEQGPSVDDEEISFA